MPSSPLLSLSPEKTESEMTEKVSYSPFPPTTPGSPRAGLRRIRWLRRRKPVPHFGDPHCPALEHQRHPHRCRYPALHPSVPKCTSCFGELWKYQVWQKARPGPDTTDQLSGSILLVCSGNRSSPLRSPSSPMHFPRISKSHGTTIATPRPTSACAYHDTCTTPIASHDLISSSSLEKK